MEQYESAPLFKADNATLSFYSAKDGKISVSYQGWDASKTVLEWQQFVLGTAGGRGPNLRCPSAQLANPQMTPSFIRAHGTGLRA